MGLIVSKKSLFVAILHFVTAAIMLGTIVFVLIYLYGGGFGEMPDTGDTSENLSNGIAAVFTVIFLLPSMAGMLVAVPTFIFSGVKLCMQAQGQLPSKRSFIVTLVVKTIGFVLMLPVLLFVFDVPTGLSVGILHIVALAFSLASSLLEAYVRRRP